MPERTAACKFCQLPVNFLQTVGGRMIPFETERSTEGTHVESREPTGYALFVPPSQRGGREDLFLAHPGRCPKPVK